jgi:ribosomal protein L11 methyltransferase
MSGFWQLSFELGQLDANLAEEACFEVGAGSVTFVDAKDDPVLEPLPGEFRLWPTTRMRALFADVDEPRGIVRALAEALQIPQDRIQAERLEDRVWEREWLRDFHAMRFGRRLWVCPHHEEVTEPEAVIVRMDPGLAFGTGTHPTTALCLEWLDSHMVAGRRVIDFGCGSGVLAVAAVKLGAGEAHCFDIDPQALTATRENAAANDVQSRVTICETADALPRGVDVLVANILSGPLCELAPTFGALVRTGGSIMLAGLLEAEVADVTRACDAWFDIHPFKSRDGWAGLSGKRNTHAPPGAGNECSQSVRSAR